MKHDVGSNYTLGEEIASAVSTDSADSGAGVDHALAPSVSFYLTASAVTTSLDMKAQYADLANFSDAVDYPADDVAGNDDEIVQLTDAGVAQLNIPNPRGRYSRVIATSVGACNYAVVSVLGPLRSIVPA